MSESYNILNDYPQDKYNLLIPVQSIQEVNPIYRLVVNMVKVSTDEGDKDIYREKNAGEGMFALTHQALTKLFTAANGQIVETTRVRTRTCENCIEIVKATGKAPSCGGCAARSNVAVRVTIKLPEMSGGWRLIQMTREMDFSNMGHLKDGQIRQTKAYAVEHAESKALSRCIRKGLSIKSAYTLDELEKPFIVVYPVLDSRDADVKKALIAGAMASSNLLYGSGLQLNAGAPAALPEGRNVDMSTGEIIESEYEAGPPEGMPWEQEEQSEAEALACSKCGVEIAQNVYDFSAEKFGAPLCMKCQQAARKGGK
jgi:hypothetical protein